MSGPNGDPGMSLEDGIINDEEEFCDEEYIAINSMLDQINSYLDGLEERNDALNGKMHELLESNRQARLEFRAQLQGSKTEDELLSTDGKEEQNEDDGSSQMSDKSS